MKVRVSQAFKFDLSPDYYADDKNALGGRKAFYFERQTAAPLLEGARTRCCAFSQKVPRLKKCPFKAPVAF